MYKYIVQLRSVVLVFLTHTIALPVLRIVRHPNLFPYTKDQLQNMPEGSLGRDLYTFLKNKKLELLPYYAKHDIKHILLGYDTTDEGEVCLQMFMLGNKHLSFPVVATVLYGLVTMPEHWKSFYMAYKRGKANSYIESWDWFGLLCEQTSLLKAKIR